MKYSFRGLKRWKSYLLMLSFSVFLLSCLVQACNTQKESTKPPPSGSVASTLPKVLPDSLYVGTETCQSCHAEAFADWQHSHHDEAMQVASRQHIKAPFKGETFRSNGLDYRFFQRDDEFFVNTQNEKGKRQDFKILHTFGTEPLQQYIVAFPNGRFQCLRAAWDTEALKWFDLYPDMQLEEGEWLYWTNGGMNWNTMCADCHSTNLRKNYRPGKMAFETEYSIINVSCESCHGPGKAHVAAIQQGDTSGYNAKAHLFLTSGQDNKTQVAECARCHMRREQISESYNHQGKLIDHYIPEILRDHLYHADGQIMDEDYVYGSFVQSKMYHQGVKCTDCHNPHSLELKAIGNNLCAQCHSPAVYDSKEHHFHGVETEAGECINCHMTGKYYMVNDFRRDHSFRVPRPDQSVQFGTPNACNGCHEEQSAEWAAEKVREWYGETRDPHFSDALTMGSTRSPEAVAPLQHLLADTTQPAIARATAVWYLSQILPPEQNQAAVKALKDEDPLVRYHSVVALNALPMESRVATLGPLLKDQSKAVRIAVAEALAEVRPEQLPVRYQGLLLKAKDEYEAVMKVQADFPGGQMNLARYHERQGDDAEAEAHYQTAIQLDERFNAARINLAHLKNRKGQNREAVNLFKTVMAMEPDYAPAYYSLGLLYAEMQQLDSASQMLSRAAELQPENPRIFYNWGLALQQGNDRKGAERVFLKGLEQHPQHPDLQYAICVLYLQDKRFAAAERYALSLAKQYPQNQQFQQILQMIARERQ